MWTTPTSLSPFALPIPSDKRCAGEYANWAGASKAVSEWFPKRERGLAAAFYDSGSSVGGAVAPFLILPVYFRWGWRVAFVIPGMLGFLKLPQTWGTIISKGLTDPVWR